MTRWLSADRSGSIVAVWLLIPALVFLPPDIARSQPSDGAPAGAGRRTPPTIVANPNPVIVASGLGTTTIDWRCESPEAEVYLSVNGGPEQIFSRGMVGHQEVPWISAGPAYEFRLYEGSQRKLLLAAVTVTGSRTPVTPTTTDRDASPPIDASAAPPVGADRPAPAAAVDEGDAMFIRASPNPIPADAEPAVTTISWKASSPDARVFLSVNGGPEQPFSGGMRGEKSAEWITAGPTYEFRLYDTAERTHLLASVPVTRDRIHVLGPPNDRNAPGWFTAIATLFVLALFGAASALGRIRLRQRLG